MQTCKKIKFKKNEILGIYYYKSRKIINLEPIEQINKFKEFFQKKPQLPCNMDLNENKISLKIRDNESEGLIM